MNRLIMFICYFTLCCSFTFSQDITNEKNGITPKVKNAELPLVYMKDSVVLGYIYKNILNDRDYISKDAPHSFYIFFTDENIWVYSDPFFILDEDVCSRFFEYKDFLFFLIKYSYLDNFTFVEANKVRLFNTVEVDIEPDEYQSIYGKNGKLPCWSFSYVDGKIQLESTPQKQITLETEEENKVRKNRILEQMEQIRNRSDEK